MDLEVLKYYFLFFGVLANINIILIVIRKAAKDAKKRRFLKPTKAVYRG